MVFASTLLRLRLIFYIYGIASFSMDSTTLPRKRKCSSRSSSTIMRSNKIPENEESDREKTDRFATTPNSNMSASAVPSFRRTTVANAKSLTDGFLLKTNKSNRIVLPFIGYGTYKLGKEIARSKTLEALRLGYRCVDTAFIYGGETIEKQVGLAVQGKHSSINLEHVRFCQLETV